MSKAPLSENIYTISSGGQFLKLNTSASVSGVQKKAFRCKHHLLVASGWYLSLGGLRVPISKVVVTMYYQYIVYKRVNWVQHLLRPIAGFSLFTLQMWKCMKQEYCPKGIFNLKTIH